MSTEPTPASASASAVSAAAAVVAAAAASGKARSALDEMAKSGAFERKPSVFRDTISADGPFPPAAGRYRLYISYACPWACRCLATLHLKGLSDAIQVFVVHPTWGRTRPDDAEDAHCGWLFRAPTDLPVSSSAGYGSFDCRDCVPDDHCARSIRDLYEQAGDTGGKYTVPVLWDTLTKTIVNNESEEIVRIFNGAFNTFAAHPEVDLCPSDLMPAILEVNAWVYPTVNNGVYRCGFAKSQAAYDVAVDELNTSLDRLEDLLSRQRYLCGDVLTEADVRLFHTLIRFDEVYVVYFKTNSRCIREYPNLLNFTRELYQMPAMRASVNMYHIKTHYFSSHPTLNAYAIVPKGPGSAVLDAPHNRDRHYQTPHPVVFFSN